jgi:hypothetical protein
MVLPVFNHPHEHRFSLRKHFVKKGSGIEGRSTTLKAHYRSVVPTVYGDESRDKLGIHFIILSRSEAGFYL